MDERVAARGIYDEFPGHRLPSDGELDAALGAALVVVDANVLLNLYRYNESTRVDLLGVLSRLGERLWVPHQVMQEFWRNRLSVLAGRASAGKQFLDALGKQRRAANDALDQWAKATAIPGPERDALAERLAELYAGVEAAVSEHTPAVVGRAADDPVLHELEHLLAGKVGARPDEAEWQLAAAEGNRRVANGEPPGYLDAKKAGSDLPEEAAGDYLVWSQSILEAARREADLLIVTGDEKEDWWWRHRSEFLGPRTELADEFTALGGRRLFLLRPVDLLKRADALAFEVRSGSVDDADRVSREVPADPLWTGQGVRTLLDLMDLEGLVQADVIRAAAANGGSVDRASVYRIGKFDDDRMLRGFTKPAARITAELQDAGVVRFGVEPALTPVYRGGVKAVEFRIPDEVALILGDAEWDDEAEKPAVGPRS
ncbi:PIN-like domain-containing protein [Actinosynnema sp. NPDC050436]|uniref:PIN-like domain-containing protein n=1 Tax=Actinosynnema sp. NPDC050436 TaxID=3155659 RepID=UPI0033E83282